MRLLEGVPKNTKVVALLEPASSTLAAAANFYLPLLMKGSGLGEMEIGWLSTIGLLLGCGMQLCASFFVNRLGRRRSLLLFSLLCWSVPLLLWSFVTSYAGFLIAALFQSTARITTVAHYCYLTEDVPEENKQPVFSFLALASSVGGLFTALLTPLIASMGLIAAARWLYLASLVCMTVMFALRYRLTTETGPGLRIAKDGGGPVLGCRKGLREYFAVCRTFASCRDNRRYLLVFMAMTFIGSMGFVQVLFLENTLCLPTETISLMPAVTALTGIALFLLHQRAFRKRRLRERGLLWGGLGATAASFLVLCFAPSGQTPSVLIFYILNSIGGYLYNISINPLLNNGMEELTKAETYSTIQLLAILVSIPSGVVTGFLFRTRPLFPFMLILLLLLACGAALLSRGKKCDAAATSLTKKLLSPSRSSGRKKP